MVLRVVELAAVARDAAFLAEVERRLSLVEELEAVVSANLQRAARLRQSILKWAFEGRLVDHWRRHGLSLAFGDK